MSAILERSLIPLRALNQSAYCPRLYYLEYVEAVMPVNEHVEDGLFLHRRVNDEKLAGKPRKEGDSLHTRSIHLSSEQLGLTGKLDVLEEKDDLAYPIEYKRSTAPRDDKDQPTFYENDAFQLCGQALLLEEELQRTIPSGILYYIGSKERVKVEFTSDLRQKTLGAIEEIRRLDQLVAPPEPLPLELRHRCFGCSLAPICLPEETLFQIRESTIPPSEPDHDMLSQAALPRVIPGSDVGAVLYVQEPGAFVSKRSEHLVVRKDNKELCKAPLTAVRHLCIMGNVQVSTQALETLAAHEIPVSYMTGHGRFIGTFQPAPTKNVQLRQDQYRRFNDPACALTLAQAVVKAKVSNQRTLLMRSLRSQTEQRGSDEAAAQAMGDLLPRIDNAASLESLLGLEGQGAALYFSQFHRFIKALPPGRSFDFHSRNRRPPRDPVNALLSFAYALLVKDCFSALCAVGFDPYAGFYHTGRHGRPSLALDLMEEFRSIIADSVVLTLINNRIVAPDDFLVWREACQLNENGRGKFFRCYEERKATEVRHPIYGYSMTYSRMLEVQARMLAAFIRGDIPTYTGFLVR
jgi:CRISPR-associated protein Cas1